MRCVMSVLSTASHTGGVHGAPARERSGVWGPPRATEPGCGAEPHVNE